MPGSAGVQDGHFTIEELHWPWKAKDTSNPVAALRAALKRAGVVGDLTVWRAGEGALHNPLTALARQREDWWLEAQRQADTKMVATCRPKMKLQGRKVPW